MHIVCAIISHLIMTWHLHIVHKTKNNNKWNANQECYDLWSAQKLKIYAYSCVHDYCKSTAVLTYKKNEKKQCHSHDKQSRFAMTRVRCNSQRLITYKQSQTYGQLSLVYSWNFTMKISGHVSLIHLAREVCNTHSLRQQFNWMRVEAGLRIMQLPA